MKIEKWINKNINKNNFKNKNIFITGANSGIGYELALHLAKLSANLFLLCRNLDRANNAKNDILKQYPDTKINIIQLDLASFVSIEKAIKEIKKYDIDCFINNAGVFRLPKSSTKDGLEIIMGTNYIGTMYLNNLLLPYLKSLKNKVHVIFESSISSKYASINYDDFFMDKKYKKMSIYARSKLAINNLYLSYLDEYKDTNLILSLTHPGGTYTPLILKGYRNKIFHFFASIFMKMFFHSPKKASLTMLYALNKDNNVMVGPRNFFQISGYPKAVKFKFEKNYKKCLQIGYECIKKINDKK